ncbi:hypothetical protein [Psychrobacter sp. I-STPA10]|uniref:hypothetical protein n=1 Tax=Psychrobacter sp. I-STPA10 TaxID=2585769 RepID=UPI001E4CF9B0|nr:hypothetical protein [Psychrobacter sp. I-STPA10]
MFSISISSYAVLTCDDVKYDGNESYGDNMEILAKEARLPDNYFNRYHEDVVSNMCKGDEASIEWMIDTGYVRRSEVEGIREALGLDERTETGRSYEYSRNRFYWDMNLSSAFSSNVADYYVHKPESQCGQLAKQALEGNPRAIAELQKQPDYCTWNYED